MSLIHWVKNEIRYWYHDFLVKFWFWWGGPMGFIMTRIHLNIMDEILVEQGIIKVAPFEYNFLDPEFRNKLNSILADHRKISEEPE